MEVVQSVRFPKIFSPRVLIRDSNRVNEFDTRRHGFESTSLTLSLQYWESPVKPQRFSAFSILPKHDSGLRDSSSDIDSLSSPGSVLGLSPRDSGQDDRYLTTLSPEGTDQSFQTLTGPVWNWHQEEPHDLSTSRSQPKYHGWVVRDAPPSPPSDDSSKHSGIHPRHCGGRFSKGKVKVFRCPYCVITCSNRGQLLGHIRIHTGERPFVCQESGCKKAFIRNEELTRHRRIHTGERPYVCDTCKKAFTRKDHLNKHMKIHSNTEEIFSV